MTHPDIISIISVIFGFTFSFFCLIFTAYAAIKDKFKPVSLKEENIKHKYIMVKKKDEICDFYHDPDCPCRK